MIFPIYYLLIAYGILMAMAGLFIIFNLYHILMFGLENFKTAFVVLLYLGATLGIAYMSYVLITQFDWSGEIILSDLIRSIIPSIL
ncbi:hypothetical protein KJ673_00620 [Patescibacteria group bacterium]|nr:hypothetical protein [Patescibacteria group bacterium]MBU4452716.1 hypothetical protein [Patescibacteria group bacterium]